jgi:hypothetical protein
LKKYNIVGDYKVKRLDFILRVLHFRRGTLCFGDEMLLQEETFQMELQMLIGEVEMLAG